MKQQIQTLMQNELFVLLVQGVFAYTLFVAAMITVLQVPPESILDSGLEEVLLVFDEYPDDDR